MKFALIAATLALVSGTRLVQKDIQDINYDTHLGALTGGVTNNHHDAESTRNSNVAGQSDSDVWRGVKPTFGIAGQDYPDVVRA